MANENCNYVVSINTAGNSRIEPRWPFFVLLLIVVCLFGPYTANLRGQSDNPLETIGVPTFSSMLPVENGSINAANGNLHLEFPLATVPQRGGPPLKVSLTYDSSIWNFSGCCSAIDGVFSSEAAHLYFGSYLLSGWKFVTSADYGNAQFIGNDIDICSIDGMPRDTVWNNFVWTSPDGTPHAFSIYTVEAYTTRCGVAPYPLQGRV